MSLIRRLKAFLQQNGDPEHAVVAIDGMLGSGKSTVAEQMVDAFGDETIVLATDEFIVVTRHQWDEYLAGGDDIVLADWYDLDKIARTLERARRGEKFTVEGLYNLSNGQLDRTRGLDARRTRMVIIEGLFALHEKLRDLADVKVFLDIAGPVALERARSRDLTARNIAPEQFEKKMRIYHDCYLPHVEQYRSYADIVHKVT
jgi:uridine kinase